LKAIFVVGTAGSGKSLLASKMREHYTASGAFVASVNLDPGVEDLPYTCDVDVRDHVDIVSIMRRHGLGPNGALVMANDLVASKIGDVWAEADAVNPDYAIVDTPGQIELFAYRASGPFIATGINADERACAFLFDGMLVNSPANFVSIALLAESVRLRLAMPTVHALTKADMAPSSADEVAAWSEDTSALAGARFGTRSPCPCPPRAACAWSPTAACRPARAATPPASSRWRPCAWPARAASR